MMHRARTFAVIGLWIAVACAVSPIRAADVGTPSALKDITFNDVKFDMQKDDPFKRSMLTPQIEKLDGTRVRIRGYIRPSFQESGITKFVLVRDNQECCFGPGAFLFDCIVVELPAGHGIEYTVRPVTVEGTFSVNELIGPGEKHLAIYKISGEAVK